MKKLSIALALLLVSGFAVSQYWNRSPVTPQHELALQALANRYIDAFCHNPRALASVISQNTTLSLNLLNRTVSYLEELIEQEGACYGQSKRNLKNETVNSIYQLADFIVETDMATELGVGDFYDCLVDVERSFVDLASASIKILECVESLDIRGFWYHALVDQHVAPEPPVVISPSPEYPAYPIVEPILPTPISDPDIIGGGPGLDPIYDHCMNVCLSHEGDTPIPEA